jgi:hypothetical protein
LEQFLELILGHGRFHFKDLLPDTPVFKDLDGKIVEVYFQYPDTGLRELIDELPLKPLHLDGFFRFIWADKERNFVSEALLLEKPLSRDYGQ